MQVCIFEGRLGQDPEKRVIPSGKSVVNVTLAVTKRQKGDNKTIWVPLTFWEKSADLAEQYLKRGSRILVRTEFDMQDWQDKDGNKRQSPKFTVFEMEFLDSKPQSQQIQQHDPYQSPPQNQGYQNSPPDNFQNNQRQYSDEFADDD